MSYEDYFKKVRETGSLYQVPTHLIDEAMCMEAVSQKGSSLFYVPLQLKTAELCDIALQDEIRNLRHVPEKLITYGMAECAVMNSDRALGYIPPVMRTEELCDIVLTKNHPLLYMVPEKLRYRYSEYGEPLVPHVFKRPSESSRIVNMINDHIKNPYVNGKTDKATIMSMKFIAKCLAEDFVKTSESEQIEIMHAVEKDIQAQYALHWLGMKIF